MNPQLLKRMLRIATIFTVIVAGGIVTGYIEDNAFPKEILIIFTISLLITIIIAIIYKKSKE